MSTSASERLSPLAVIDACNAVRYGCYDERELAVLVSALRHYRAWRAAVLLATPGTRRAA